MCEAYAIGVFPTHYNIRPKKNPGKNKTKNTPNRLLAYQCYFLYIEKVVVAEAVDASAFYMNYTTSIWVQEIEHERSLFIP